MEIRRASLETCGLASGTVVVIDVIRAFTTAAYAFAAGARDIVLTGTVEEALGLRQAVPGALAMGEVDGAPVEGFDFGNSPSALIGLDLGGRQMIQRTSAGTQGVVRSTSAAALLGSSFVCAAATVRYLRQHPPADLTLVATGAIAHRDGDEDVACAVYLEELVRNQPPCENRGLPQSHDVAPYLQRVLDSTTGRIFASGNRPEYPAADLECCLAVDRFDFAMPVFREDGLLVMKRHPI